MTNVNIQMQVNVKAQNEILNSKILNLLHDLTIWTFHLKFGFYLAFEL
jgi:hypothetical protein